MKSLLLIFILVLGTSASEYYFSLVDCSLSLVRPSDQFNNIIATKDVKLENCNEAKILWNYPINNLTLVFFAPKSKPFEFCLKDLDYFTNINKVKVNGDIKVYNGESNQELQITKGGNKVCWKSGINKTFQLKLAASSQLKYYGVIIDYSIKV